MSHRLNPIRRIRSLRNVLLLATTAVSLSAVAQGYVGLSLGQSRTDISCVGSITCDKNGTAYKIFGGYMFSPYLGLEASWYERGNSKQTLVDPGLGAASLKWSGQSYGLFGIAAAPFDRGAIFAKIGGLRSDLKREISGTSTTSSSNSRTDFAWGLGASYKYSSDASARIEIERIRAEFGGTKLDVDLVTLGFLFRF